MQADADTGWNILENINVTLFEPKNKAGTL